MIRWCEITDRIGDAVQPRLQILNEELGRAGLEAEVVVEVATVETLPQVLEVAKAKYAQIRFTGRTGAWAWPHLDRQPSSLFALRSCDALVYERGEWWPRCFLVEGLNQTIASDAGTLDFDGTVLILGTSTESRAAVAALSRVGFNRMIVSDPSAETGERFVQDLARSFFGVQFQSVARSMVTQLPGICSIAVNTLTATEDAQSISELAYFNFMKPGGAWLDLSIFPLSQALQNEAISVGATLLSGSRAIATTDRLWAEAVFKVVIDVDAYASRLSPPEAL